MSMTRMLLPPFGVRHATLRRFQFPSTMRIAFVHPAREQALCTAGPVTLGSAPDDSVTVTGNGVAAHHASLSDDARGLVLSVRAGCQRVYVNARPVRERALLHYGDVIVLGDYKLRVGSDAKPEQEPSAAVHAADAVDTACLRIVSGARSGQSIVLAPNLRIGSGCRDFGDLVGTATFSAMPGGVAFAGDGIGAHVNGWATARAHLHDGDQIVIGPHRMLVELTYAEPALVATRPVAAPARAATAADAPQSGVWWLIVAAAVLAAAIALLLYFRW